MWQYVQTAPSTLELRDAPAPEASDVREGELLLEFQAGSICGSDIPKFRGELDPDNPYTGEPGVPLHELVARVCESRAEGFARGDRVVGIIAESRGLAEFIVNPAKFVHRIDNALSDIEATVIQPVATVLSAYSRVRGLGGRRVAVLGLGSLGILFAQIAKHLGAAHVVGVDTVDRQGLSASFGLDEVAVTNTRSWAWSLPEEDRPDLVVDAIGHRQEILADAVSATARGGEVLMFGLPEDNYVFPMREFFRKGLSLSGGTTQDWPKYLREAEEYVIANRVLQEEYITHIISADRVQDGFELYSTPRANRLKVAISPFAR